LAALLADEPTPRAVDEDMPVAVIVAVVVADFPVHPPGLFVTALFDVLLRDFRSTDFSGVSQLKVVTDEPYLNRVP
jgi:hypothetical protein